MKPSLRHFLLLLAGSLLLPCGLLPCELWAEDLPEAGGKDLPELTEEQTEQAAGPTFADRNDEQGLQMLVERLPRIHKESGTGIVAVTTGHVTVVASKRQAAMLLPDLKRLETALADNFPAPFGTGTNKKHVNLVFLETKDDYQKWMYTYFTVMKEAGLRFPADAEKKWPKSPGLIGTGMSILCTEGMPTESVRRRAAYSFGFHHMKQLSRGRAPISMQVGFANLTEQTLHRSPVVVMGSFYYQKDTKRTGNRWSLLVKKQFTKRKIKEVRHVLDYQLPDMDEPNFAETWSLVSFLATGSKKTSPKKFSELVKAIGDGKEPMPTIEEIYELQGKLLLTRWRSFARRQR